jgi:tetratricopeptide (TPR) repeat protein
VTCTSPIEPAEFVGALKPLLQTRNPAALCQFLNQRFSLDQITGFLDCHYPDARKVACLALSLVGDKYCIPLLARQLRDQDPMINQMAEHALWSVWFRCGSPAANDQLGFGIRALEHRQFKHAIEHFNQAIELSPEFAEAYNQRAIAHCLMEKFKPSIEDGLLTLSLMPCHFSAWAGMGHCHAHQGCLDDALHCYQQALNINPHLDCIRQAIEELTGRSQPKRGRG